MPILYNQTTQPVPLMPIFNNWEVVAQGWYIACPSRSLPSGKARSLLICGQRLVVFRGEDGQVRSLDAFCPHMGTDLGMGKVKGDRIQCIFHHWEFDDTGGCQHIPCQTEIPEKARVRSYATAEKYGFIWVYPAASAEQSVPEFDDLVGKSVSVRHEKPQVMKAHHHICMMNGVDLHHYQTTHQFDTALQVTWNLDPSGTSVSCTFSGEYPTSTLRDRLARQFLGPTCTFTVKFAHGCIGLLTTNQTSRSLGALHMLLAFMPTEEGKTRIQPIYITEQRSGLLGWLTSQFMLWLTQLQFYILQGDEATILNQMQFNPQVLLDIDRHTEAFIDYVNQLEPSVWSK